MSISLSKPRFVFFGTPDIAVHVLNELERAGYRPDLIVTNPDQPVGRAQTLTPPPTKVWATERGIQVVQPTHLKDEAELSSTFSGYDVFIVAAYGKIIPSWLLALPAYGTLNVHPSLLPKLRGASPIRSAILEDIRETGVTIMLMDSDLDHGPILAQEKAELDPHTWPIRGTILDTLLASQGGRLLARTLPQFLEGNIEPQAQDHTHATFCAKITKSMGELMIDPLHLPVGDEAYAAYLKVCAFDGWPGTYCMHNNRRIKITDARLSPTGAFEILTVIPEGKREQPFSQYLASQ
jgi:methionyl-tRNA formyltransferase